MQGCMREDNLGFRIADVMDGCESSCRGLKSCVVGKADILRGMDENAPGDESGILAGMDQAGQPVQGDLLQTRSKDEERTGASSCAYAPSR